MTNEFKDEPEVAVALFHIGQELFWQRQFGEARDVFDRGVELFPAGPAAEEMKLWSAKTACCVLIYSRRATDAEIVASIDKMLNDFNDDAGLPGAVYWLSKEYEWTKGTSLSRAAWYDKPNSVYQQLMQKFSDTPFGQQAELDQKRLNHRMKIFNLMKEPNQNAIDTAIEEMVVDLNGSTETAGELYWVACGFEEKENGPYAMRMYERIVRDYPGTPEANSATLDIRRRIITDLINAEDIEVSEALMDKFIADFNSHPYAGACLGRVAIGYYKKGYELREANDIDDAKRHFEQSAKTYERIITNNLTVVSDAPYFYFYAGANYLELKQRDKAIVCLQKVADDWPEFEHACSALAGIGGTYEYLRDKEGVPKEAVNPLIEEAYKKILTNYPGCYAAKEAARRLVRMKREEGDTAAADEYFKIFLEKVQRKNVCTTSVKEN
jgi:tetratricopeptide (TPR) repeat protein